MKNKDTKKINLLLKKGKVAIPIVLIAIVMLLSFLLYNVGNNKNNLISKVEENQEALNSTEYIYRKNLKGYITNNNITIYPDRTPGIMEYNVRYVELQKKNAKGEYETYSNAENGKYQYLHGDVNNDGEINKYDAGLIWGYLAGQANLTEVQKLAADINGDGILNNIDYQIILYTTESREYIIGNPSTNGDNDKINDNFDNYNEMKFLKSDDARLVLRAYGGMSEDGEKNPQENKETLVIRMLADIDFDYKFTYEEVILYLRASANLEEDPLKDELKELCNKLGISTEYSEGDVKTAKEFIAEQISGIIELKKKINNALYYSDTNNQVMKLNMNKNLLPEIVEEGEYKLVTRRLKNANDGGNIKLRDKNGSKTQDFILNHSENAEEYEFVIDKTAPTVTGTSQNPNSDKWTNKNVTVTLTFDEDVKKSGDNEYSKSQDITITDNGTVNTTFYDKAGNSVNVPTTVTNIDRTPAVISARPSTMEDSKNLFLLITANDDGITQEQYITSDLNGNGKGNVTVYKNTDNTAMTLSSCDNNGNKDASDKNYTRCDITENGTYEVKVTDKAGNVTRTSIVIDNIDKTSPVYSVVYSTVDPTNGTVTATIYFSEEVKKENTNEFNTVFKEDFTSNGTSNKKFTDKAGNEITVNLTVNNIDKTEPNLTVTKKIEGSTEWTSENATLNIVATDSDIAFIKVNGGVISTNETEVNGIDYIVTENGEYKVEVIDKAGNVSAKKVTVSNIDKTPAVISVKPSTTNKTKSLYLLITANDDGITQDQYITSDLNTSGKGNVSVYRNSGSSTLTVNSSDGNGNTSASKKNYTKCEITENGIYEVKVTDKAQNITRKTILIDNIDKINPTEKVIYSEYGPTNNNVTATVYFSEPVSVSLDNKNSYSKQYFTTYTYDFSENGTKTLNYKDEAGNEKSVELNVQNIDKTAPNAPTITGNPTNWTNEDATLNITASDNDGGLGIAEIKVNGAIVSNTSPATYEVDKNGEYDVEIVDKAGNVTSQAVNVTKIDKVEPTVHVNVPDLRASVAKTLTVDAYDGLSKVKSVTVNGNTPNKDNDKYTETITENGTYKIAVTDNAGNTKTITQTVENIDQSKPNVTIQSPGSRYILSSENGKDSKTSKITAKLHSYDENGILKTMYIWCHVKDEKVTYLGKDGKEKDLTGVTKGDDGASITSANILKVLDAEGASATWQEVNEITQNELVLEQEFKEAGLYVLFAKTRDKANNEYIAYKEYEIIDEPITSVTYKAGTDEETTEDLSQFTDNKITEPMTIELKYDTAVKSKEVSFDHITYYDPNKFVIRKNGTLVITVKDCNDNTYVKTVDITKIDENRPIVTIEETGREGTTISYRLHWNKEDMNFTTNNVIVKNAEKCNGDDGFKFDDTVQNAEGEPDGKTATLKVDYKNKIKNNETKDVEIYIKAEDALDNDSYLAYYSSRVDRKVPELKEIKVYVDPKVVTVNSDISRTKKDYNSEETITIEAIFDEDVQLTEDGKYPTLNISFGDNESLEKVQDGEVLGNVIKYTYQIKSGDNGKISIDEFSGKVKDDQGNILNIQNYGNMNVNTIIADTILPYVTKVDITTTDKKTNLKNDDEITFVVNFNESIYKRNENNVEKITTVPNFKFKLGETERTLSNGQLSEDGKKVTYTYKINNDNGKLSLMRDTDKAKNSFGSYGDSIVSDIAGNKFTVENNEINKYGITLNGEDVTDNGDIDIESDSTPVAIEDITMTNANGHDEYQTGDRIDIKVNFTEELYTSDGKLLTDAINEDVNKRALNGDIKYDVIDPETGSLLGYIIDHVDSETRREIKDEVIYKYLPDLILDIDGRDIKDDLEFEDIENIDGKTVISYSYVIKYEDYGGIEVESYGNKDIYDKAGNKTNINYSGTDFNYYEKDKAIFNTGSVKVNRVKAPFVKYIVKVQNESGEWIVKEGGNYKKGDKIQIVAGFDGYLSSNGEKPNEKNNLEESYKNHNANLYSLKITDEEGNELDTIRPLTDDHNRNSNVTLAVGKERPANKTIDKNMVITYTYDLNKENLDSNIKVGIYNEENGSKGTLRNYKDETYTYSKDILSSLGITIDTTMPKATVNDNELKAGEEENSNNTLVDEADIEVKDIDISSWTLEKQITTQEGQKEWITSRSGAGNPYYLYVTTPGKYRLTLIDKAGNTTIYYFEIVSSNDVKDGIIGQSENTEDYPKEDAPLKFTGFNKYEDDVLTKNDVTVSLKEANHKLKGEESENNSLQLQNGLIISKVEYVAEDIRIHWYEENYNPQYTEVKFGETTTLSNLDASKDYTVKVTIVDTAGQKHEIYYYITIDQQKPLVKVEVSLADSTLKNNDDIYKEGTRLNISVIVNEPIYNEDEKAEKRTFVTAPKLKVYFGEGEEKKQGTASNGYAVYQFGSTYIYSYAYTIGQDDNGPISLEFDSKDVYDKAGNKINLLDDSKEPEPVEEEHPEEKKEVQPRVTFKYNDIIADAKLPTVDIKLYNDDEEITTGYTNKDELKVEFIWSENVTGFDVSDVSIYGMGETLSEFTGPSEDGTHKYTAKLNTSSIQEGTIRIGIEQNAVRDKAGNYNVRKEISIIKDKKAPTLESLTTYAVEPYKIEVDDEVSPYKEYYKDEEQVVVEAVFSEAIQDEDLPTLNLKLGKANVKGEVETEVSGDTITYTYTITDGDNGEISVGKFAGTVKDLAGNTKRIAGKDIDGETVIADTTDPVLKTVNIKTQIDSTTQQPKTNVKAGDTITIELEYSENVYDLEESEDKLTNTIINLAKDLISSDYFTLSDEDEITVEENKVIYTATINDNVNEKLNTVGYNGTVYDIAGNALTAETLPQDTKVLVNGNDVNNDGSEEGKGGIVVDTTKPTANENSIIIDAVSDIQGTAPYYKAGTNLTIKISLAEDIKVCEGNELQGGVKVQPITQSEIHFGEEVSEENIGKGKLTFKGYEDKTLIFEYTIEDGDNGDFNLVIPENAIEDLAGNLNDEITIEYGEQAGDKKGVVADTIAPTINLQSDIQLSNGSGNTFNVTANFSEDLYDVKDNTRTTLDLDNALQFIYTYNGTGERTSVKANSINGNKITYTFNVEADKEVATSKIEKNGFTGTAYDRAGNGYSMNQTSIFIRKITVSLADDEQTNEYNRYKAGTKINIEVELNKEIAKSQNDPTIKIKFGDSEEEHELTGNISDNKITFEYTIANGDNGELKVTQLSGVVKDVSSGNDDTFDLEDMSIDGLARDTIIADTTAPIATVTVQNVNNITNADTITYKIKWSEEVIGFEENDIKVQNGTIINYKYDENSNEATIEVLKQNEGKQIVFIAANVCEDQAGNENIRSEINNITIDTTEPTIRAIVNGGNYVIDSSTQKSKIETKLEISEEISSLKYKWSKETAENVDMSDATEVDLTDLDINDIPIATEISEEGTWYLYITATDIAGNTKNAKTKAFNVKASTIEITLSKEEKTNTDIVANVKYGEYLTEKQLLRIGEQGSADASKITVKENGTVHAEATDGHGNKVIAEKEVTNIFKNPPEVKVTEDAGTITVETTDNGAGIKSTTVKGPDGENIEQNEDGTYTVTENGTYTVTVEDEAGNVVEKEIEVKDLDLQVETDYTIVEKDSKKYIKVSPNTTASDIIKNVKVLKQENATKEVYDKDKKVSDSDKLKTGEVMKINGEETYIIVVNGDLNKDGNISISDFGLLNDYILERKKNLETVVLIAADVTNDGEITISDFGKLNAYLLGRNVSL